MSTRPFLKWVGGKTQILDSVLELFPTEIVNYHEPFLGGGSVLLGVLSLVKTGRIKITGKTYASDVNANLIGLYRNIQSDVESVISEVRKLTQDLSRCQGAHVYRTPSNLQEALSSRESYFYWIRQQFNALPNESRTTPMASAMFLFLNKTCFRGMYREGPHGFNVPYGNYTNPVVVSEEHIRAVSTLLQDVVFTVASFSESLSRVRSGDFVYLDPPYAPETPTAFVAYTSSGFDEKSHQCLFNICKELHNNGVQFVMSNSNASIVREAFPPPTFKTKMIVCRRAINSKHPDSTTNELLISNLHSTSYSSNS